MSGDPRIGSDESGYVEIEAADGSTPQTAVEIPATALFRVDQIKIEYDDGASATADLEVYDDPDGTAAGDLTDQRDAFLNIDSDTRIAHVAEYRVFENDVLVATAGGNQDGVLGVTVYGEVLTDLEDITQV